MTDKKCMEHVDLWLKMSRYMFDHWDDDYIWDMTGTDQVQYVAMLSQLKKNEENVPAEQLKTKYRKAYDRLRHDLQLATYKLMYDVVLHGLLIRQREEDRAYAEINQLIKESGITKEISRAVFRDKDLGRIENNIMQLRKQVHSVAERRLDDGD